MSLTFEPDHQGNLELQFSAGFGDAISNDGTVNNTSKDVHQDGLYLNTENKRKYNVLAR